MTENSDNDSSSGLSPEPPFEIQHAWRSELRSIARETEWIISARWRFLLNHMRTPHQDASTDDSDSVRQLLADMNAGPVPRDFANVEPQAVARNKSVRSLDGERFIGELTVRFFIKLLRARPNDSRETIENSWRRVISEALIALTEASVIEILKHSHLVGDIAVASFTDTVNSVRRLRGPDYDVELLEDEFCINCFRRCFDSTTTSELGERNIAPNVTNEHFPFLERSDAETLDQRVSIQRFIDQHENLILALNHFEKFLKPLSSWFTNLSDSLLLLDPPEKAWVGELREVIFGEDDAWVLGARKLIDVIVAAEAILEPKSRRMIRPTRPDGHYWHLIDLGTREFLSTVVSRAQRLGGEASNLKVVWLQSRVEWLWWQALFSSNRQLNDAAVEGLKRRQVNIPMTGKAEPVNSAIQKIEIDSKDSTESAGAGDDRPRVTIFGGGIAGLSAAHELVERGFDVVVLEKQAAGLATRETDVQIGGIARTQWDGIDGFPKLNAEIDDRRKYPRQQMQGDKIPGEHGYRFFPSFYRHLFDTMKRTPIRHNDEDQLKPPHLTTFDQLQPTFEQVFATPDKYVNLSRTRPRTLEGLRKEYMQLVDGLGFKQRDLARFLFKLIRYLMACSERRAADYENISMLDFFGGEGFYHEDFLNVVRAAPQALVAMDAEHGDARTQLNVYLQLLMDQVLGGEYTDNTLRGPTSDAWFVYWREYLEDLGVKFHHGNLLSITNVSDSALEILMEWPKNESATDDLSNGLSERVAASDYVVMALDAIEAERVTARWPSNGVPADLRRYATYVTHKIPTNSYRYELVAHCRERVVDVSTGHEMLVWLLSRIHSIAMNGDDGMQVLRSTLASMLDVTGEVRQRHAKVEDLRLTFWMNQQLSPRLLRQMERFVNECLSGSDFSAPRFVSDSPEFVESEQMVDSPRIPTHQYGAEPSDRFQTFTGVQYYFEQDFRLVRGHVYLPETEWGLSVISQKQFWAESSRSVDGVKLRGILSVDIGATREPSRYTGKSFLDSSSKEEVAVEVWRQIEESLRSVRGENASVTNLPLPKPRFFHVDENLEFDGHTLSRNLTPFLVNNAGDWEKRPKCMPWVPGTVSQIRNDSDSKDVWQAPHGGYRIHDNRVVFCGHYMRTFTRMTTMEAANESARHAVNAILDHISRFGLRERTSVNNGALDSISGDYCDIWNLESHELEDFDYFKRIDKMLFDKGKPHLADIIGLDRIADLLHPEQSNFDALISAISTTTSRDLGLGTNELVGITSSIIKAAQSLNKNIVNENLIPGAKLIEPINNALLGELERFKN
ncbi:MAG: FAD-dependent oxidoreductase [Pseudomonadota bacterium]